MSAKNVKTVRAAHDSWNRRDFQGVVRDVAEGLVYADHGRSLTLNARDKFREWTEGWARPSRMVESQIPNTLMRGISLSLSLPLKAQTTGRLVPCRPWPSDILAVLRDLSTRQTGTPRRRGLLLRPIHTLNSTRAHETTCRGRLRYLHRTNLPSQKARAGSARLFHCPLNRRARLCVGWQRAP